MFQRYNIRKNQQTGMDDEPGNTIVFDFTGNNTPVSTTSTPGPSTGKARKLYDECTVHGKRKKVLRCVNRIDRLINEVRET